MYRHIVHANDGTDNSFRGLEAALGLAQICSAKLDILFVEEIHPHSGSVFEIRDEKKGEDKRMRHQRERVKAITSRFDVPHKVHVFAGHPVAHIVEFVHEAKADMLVIGATEHVGIVELIFGRRSDRIAHMAECSVLIAR